MKKPSALKLPALELVSVPLGNLIVPSDHSLPEVLRVPRRSENADHLIALVIAAHTPVVGPPLRQESGKRPVLAHSATVALVRALLPVSERRSYELCCLEWKGVPDDAPSPDASSPDAPYLEGPYLEAPHAILGLMVRLPKAPRERELKRVLKLQHGLALRRRKPEALDGLPYPNLDQPR
jgi:hypothetical protein